MSTVYWLLSPGQICQRSDSGRVNSRTAGSSMSQIEATVWSVEIRGATPSHRNRESEGLCCCEVSVPFFRQTDWSTARSGRYRTPHCLLGKTLRPLTDRRLQSAKRRPAVGVTRNISHVSFWEGPPGIDPFGDPIIPEPSTAALWGFGLVAIGIARRCLGRKR
jgi:hypothetical protein